MNDPITPLSYIKKLEGETELDKRTIANLSDMYVLLGEKYKKLEAKNAGLKYACNLLLSASPSKTKSKNRRKYVRDLLENQSPISE